MAENMEQRIGKEGVLPERDVFGQVYAHPPAVVRGIANQAFVAIQAGANKEAVEQAIAEIERWMLAQAPQGKPKARGKKAEETDA